MKHRFYLCAFLFCMSFGLASRSSAQLLIRSKVMNFDTTLCGTKKCMNVVFKDTGAAPLTINTHEAFFGTFAADASTPFFYPLTLNPGDSVVYDICYSPTSAGNFDTVTSMFQYDLNSSDTLTLIGRSTGSKFSTSTTSLDFGVLPIFNTNCKTFSIDNLGDGILNLITPSATDTEFTIQGWPATVAPGGNGSVTICFTPDSGGVHSGKVWLRYFACGVLDSTAIDVTGAGSVPSKVPLGPVLQILNNPTNFDTTLCGTTKCIQTTLTNTGNASLSITQFGQVTTPFALNGGAPLSLPIILQPNQSKTIDLCYAPDASPEIDSLVIPFVADNRVSLSIAMVFDISGSMTSPTGTPGVSRIIAANTGGKIFLDNLINDPVRNIIDEAAIVQFSSAINVLPAPLPHFTTNIPLLKANVPSVASGGTRLYDAIDSTIRLLKTRNQPGRRVIVLLSDGDDNTGYVQARIDAIVSAAANNVRIFTIGIGNSLSANGLKTLASMALGTGGQTYQTNNPDTLVQIYQQIADSLSRNLPGNLTIKGRSVAPILTISPLVVNFDSVKVGNSRTFPITLRNTGDAGIRFDTLPAAVNGFSIQATLPIIIPPGGSFTANATFAPSRLRVLDTAYTFTVSPCHNPVRFAMQGVGYDSVIIALEDTVVAKPGSEAIIPIHLLSKIPAEYDVTSFEVTLSHNKTMLYPESPAAATNLTATAPFLTQSVNNAFDNTNDTSSNSFALSGTPMASASGDTILVKLRFTALLGNSVTTPVTIVSAQFADGNPKVGIVSKGIFSIDSLCYLNKRLIDASARIRGAFIIHVGQGASSVNIGYTLPSADITTLAVFDEIGQVVYSAEPGLLPAGDQENSIDSRSLRNGLYFVKIQSGGQTDNASFFIRK